MTEMSPQEAAAVWTNVPKVEQQLTARVAGMANILTGLAIAAIALPHLLLRVVDYRAIQDVAGRWAGALSPLGTFVLGVTVILLFLSLRRGIWNLYAAARPENANAVLHLATRSRGTQVAYVVAILWAAVAWWTSGNPDSANVPDTFLSRSGNIVLLLLFVYTASVGRWESTQWWSPRPYLLVTGAAAIVAAAIVLVAFSWGHMLAAAILGAGWILAGSALSRQA